MNKQNEEMAKIVCGACDFICDCEYLMKDKKAYTWCDLPKEVCEALYNAGYTQKVNDDEVVISKEKIEEIKRLEHELGYREGAQKRESFYEEIAIPTERKETAREILQEVSTIIKAIGEDYDLSGNQTLSMLCANIHSKVMDKLAEKYGVEVE